MKKTISLLLALVMCLSLCACGGGNDTPETTEAPTETTAPEEVKLSKDELLAIAEPLTQDVVAKIFENNAFAKTLESKTYTFEATVWATEFDYVEVYIESIEGDDGKKYRYNHDGLYFCLYLPTEELLEVSKGDSFKFVGKVAEVQSVSSSLEGVEAKGIAMIMHDAYIIEE